MYGARGLNIRLTNIQYFSAVLRMKRNFSGDGDDSRSVPGCRYTLINNPAVV